MKKIILFLLLSVSIFGKLNLKVIYSDPAGKGITTERAQKLNSEEFERSSKEDIKGEKTIEKKSNEKIEYVVYVTKSGKKYHRKGCVYLKSVGGSYPLKESEALGYEACRRY